MTTPQYVPPEFQDSISYNPPATNTREIARQKKIHEEQSQWAGKWNSKVNYYQDKVKKTVGKRQEEFQRRLEAAQKGLAQTQAREQAAQSRVYELSGEYGKLLTGAARDAYSALSALFSSYGLGSLAGKIYEYTKNGYSADTIAILLQDTKEYKQRFAGNEARQKAGMPVLNPAEYLAAESSYRQILQDAGLPKGFYDNPADFTHWIAGDVSPTEIKERVDMAVQATTQANPEYKRALQQMYGVDESYLTAYFLDRSRATPLLEKQAAAAQFGAAAIRRGFEAYRDEFEGYATMGITADRAEEGWGRISEGYDAMRGIAQRWGLADWDQQQAAQAEFVSGSASANRSRRLRSQERAAFSGRAGSARAGLGAGFQQT
ncbi:hypothetical protein [Streptomyces johnsoniae]|uniref:Uncharacterized protein n=1 Tax=Streptomyces johnsoniae TaxID=3075532 RepID=A0ABU2S005_9ACTN|nr:hypothetical protein [Streptomyces sp. DSM 41886]MDT0442318.1 hypothetical protein [Streptomyces sp. DSM 41886]